VDERLSDDEARALLERMREIRAGLEDDQGVQRRLRIKQADRRIRALEARLGDEATAGAPGDEPGT
jgi:microcystin degradation protein MlrC